ncbi:hypothetical protein DEU37_1455 [Microbacterium sp. AG790]|nr:hypothetical protein [Microbacterium sp. AG790]RKS90135.1 hypothetical protein DEU37_1455 [Microbacterium sp. AG790]
MRPAPSARSIAIALLALVAAVVPAAATLFVRRRRNRAGAEGEGS